MSITRDIFLQILAFLFPPVCLKCNCVEGTESLPLGLCAGCRSLLERVRSSPSTYMAHSLVLDRLLSGWIYAPPLDAVIHALKFRRMEFLGKSLATALHRLLEEELQEVDVVVPIPLHWFRRLSRGYNQAEAIAVPLGRRMGIPVIKVLRRRRPTPPQARLGRVDRAKNLRSAFAPLPTRQAGIVDRHVLLVDDVVTTGATLEEAAICLQELRASSVTALTVARTPSAGLWQVGK